MTSFKIAWLFPLLMLASSACQREPEQAPAATAAAVAGHEEHATEATLATVPPAGQRWATDAPLRAGMARVQAAADALAPLEKEPMDPERVRAQADGIQAAVNTMFAECKLEPAPDAALHPLLAQLLSASQALRDAPTNAEPLADLRAVLARYRLLFDDPMAPVPAA